LLRVSHFLFHLLSHESIPQFLNVQVFSHFKLRAIFILIGCCFSNFLISSLSFNSSLNWLFFVLDTFLKFENSFLSVLLFFLDILHQTIKNSFWLKSFFLCFSMFLIL
jgi:hypothetical protein